MNRHARASFVAAGQVVGEPSDVTRESGVDATDGDEDAGVDDAREIACSGGGDADDEADTDGAHAGEDVGGALAGAVGVPGDGDGEDGCGDVDGDGEELGCGGCVAEFTDDAGEEEGGAVERTDDAPVHWIHKTFQCCIPGEMQVVGGWKTNSTKRGRFANPRRRPAHIST